MASALIESKELLELLDKKRNGRPLIQVAPELGVSHQFLAKVIAGEYKPGPTLAKALGFEQVIAYRRAPRKANHKAKPAKKATPKKARQSTGMKATEFEPSKMA